SSLSPRPGKPGNSEKVLPVPHADIVRRAAHDAMAKSTRKDMARATGSTEAHYGRIAAEMRQTVNLAGGIPVCPAVLRMPAVGSVGARQPSWSAREARPRKAPPNLFEVPGYDVTLREAGTCPRRSSHEARGTASVEAHDISMPGLLLHRSSTGAGERHSR